MVKYIFAIVALVIGLIILYVINVDWWGWPFVMVAVVVGAAKLGEYVGRRRQRTT